MKVVREIIKTIGYLIAVNRAKNDTWKSVWKGRLV